MARIHKYVWAPSMWEALLFDCYFGVVKVWGAKARAKSPEIQRPLSKFAKWQWRIQFGSGVHTAGFDGPSNSFFSSIESIAADSFLGGSWSFAAGSLREGVCRAAAGTLAMGGSEVLIVAGGLRAQGDPVTHVDFFDPVTMERLEGPSFAEPRHDFGLARPRPPEHLGRHISFGGSRKWFRAAHGRKVPVAPTGRPHEPVRAACCALWKSPGGPNGTNSINQIWFDLIWFD